MKPKLQRIAIAEACGWKICHDAPWLGFTDCNPSRRAYPDYPNDYNAMSRAMAFIQDKRDEYGQFLVAIVTRGWPDSDVENVQKLINAITNSTPQQWSEAFLRTVGRWSDE